MLFEILYLCQVCQMANPIMFTSIAKLNHIYSFRAFGEQSFKTINWYDPLQRKTKKWLQICKGLGREGSTLQHIE